jgi:CheY-like chemotaxis protein
LARHARTLDVYRHRGWGQEMPRIVVIEDDPSMSQAIERVLNAGGFEAVSFASAEAALEAGAAAAADGLVLDIHLPGMSGFAIFPDGQGEGRHIENRNKKEK